MSSESITDKEIDYSNNFPLPRHLIQSMLVAQISQTLLQRFRIYLMLLFMGNRMYSDQ